MWGVASRSSGLGVCGRVWACVGLGVGGGGCFWHTHPAYPHSPRHPHAAHPLSASPSTASNLYYPFSLPIPQA